MATCKTPVKLGLYGCGNRTHALLDSLRGEREYTVMAAFDQRADAVAATCQKYGGRPCCTADELLGTSGIDAFLISLSPFAHADAFDATIERGKPIFIEKPIAMTAERAYRMMRKASEMRVPVQVGLMRRYLPACLMARRMLAEKPPGRLFSVACRWFHAGETEMINCLNSHPDEPLRNFRLHVSQIPFHCCHALDVMRVLAGEVRRVDARGLKVIERPYPSPDAVIALLEFQNGAIGQFHYSSMSYRHEISYLVHAENYTLAMSGDLEIYYRPEFTARREDGSRDCRPTYHANIGPEKHSFRSTMPDADIMLDFLGAVRNGTPMKVTIVDGYKAAELAEAIEQSWQQQRSIDLPLQFD